MNIEDELLIIKQNALQSGHDLSEEFIQVFKEVLIFWESQKREKLCFLFDNFSYLADIYEHSYWKKNYNRSGMSASKVREKQEISLNLLKIENHHDLKFIIFHEIGHVTDHRWEGIFNKTEKNIEKIKKKIKPILLVFLFLNLFSLYFMIPMFLFWIIINFVIFYNKIKDTLEQRYISEYKADEFSYNICKKDPNFKLECVFLSNPQLAIQKTSHPSGQMRMDYLKSKNIDIKFSFGLFFEELAKDYYIHSNNKYEDLNNLLFIFFMRFFVTKSNS